MKTKNVIIGIAVFIILIVLFNGFYVVKETEQVVVTQFGKPIKDAITSPGLHWKVPFIQTANYFEKRILAWDGDPNQIPTGDKRYIWVDATARWKIQDPLKFMQSVTTENGAHARLDDIVNSVIRDFVSENLLLELIRNSNREFTSITLERERDSLNVAAEILIGREKITDKILQEAMKTMPQFGIELVDVRLKRINYVQEVRNEVYNRMITERKRIAEEYRSEGQGQMAEIDGKRERELQKIQSQAYKTAQEIKGDADAAAVGIYASAYNRDPEFYSFVKTLQTYRETFDSTTTLLLSTKSDYLKYLEKAW